MHLITAWWQITNKLWSWFIAGKTASNRLKTNRLKPFNKEIAGLAPAHVNVRLPVWISEGEFVFLSVSEFVRVHLLELLVGQVIEGARVQLVQLRNAHLGRINVLARLVGSEQFTSPDLKINLFSF